MNTLELHFFNFISPILLELLFALCYKLSLLLVIQVHYINCHE